MTRSTSRTKARQATSGTRLTARAVAFLMATLMATMALAPNAAAADGDGDGIDDDVEMRACGRQLVREALAAARSFGESAYCASSTNLVVSDDPLGAVSTAEAAVAAAVASAAALADSLITYVENTAQYIQDDGNEIPDNELDRLFDRMTTVCNTLSPTTPTSACYTAESVGDSVTDDDDHDLVVDFAEYYLCLIEDQNDDLDGTCPYYRNYQPPVTWDDVF